jgi:hypothetical protein
MQLCFFKAGQLLSSLHILVEFIYLFIYLFVCLLLFFFGPIQQFWAVKLVFFFCGGLPATYNNNTVFFVVVCVRVERVMGVVTSKEVVLVSYTNFPGSIIRIAKIR